MTKDVNIIKKDRMRFTKNTISSTFCYLSILFNVFYFVSIYSSNIGNYYYNITIGLSVVYNLLFLLFSFLCSEGVKNYNKFMSFVMIGLGALQIGRIFYIPMKAHSTTISLEGTEILVMDDKQFVFVLIWLALSAAFGIAAGVIGVIKTNTLENYKKETGLA